MIEGPAIETEIHHDDLPYDRTISYTSVTSIDSTQKRKYICKESDDWFLAPEYPPRNWNVASDIDIELYPVFCNYAWSCKGEEFISGKNNNKYVCDDYGFREATPEEIEADNACTGCMRMHEKCGIVQDNNQ
jgi:hypothetical protein